MTLRPGRVGGLVVLLSGACTDAGATRTASTHPRTDPDPTEDSRPSDDSGGTSVPTDPTVPCTTRITYGDRWIHGDDHPAQDDVVDGLVTWDGVCTDDAHGNSYATLSNGWTPYFQGPSACVVALDASSGCSPVAERCGTLVSYGPDWIAAEGHPERSDAVDGRLFPASACVDRGGGQRSQRLSNGWEPWFQGDCQLSFRHDQCGGLYLNPVIPVDCPDPGVLAVDGGYVLACTGWGSGGVFPLRVSTDLVTWTEVGAVFPTPPSWASGDFWAPELHAFGDGWLAVYSARSAADGQLSLGVATADDPLGPWTDAGAPLLHDAGMGLIDAHVHVASDGAAFLYWKRDGNAVGQPTPLLGAPLAADGRSLAGAAVTLLTNDRSWEGDVIEGPWVLEHDGAWFLTYSGNSYASSAYALGVARASSPLGPYTKAEAPILASGGGWAGPGHASFTVGPGGDLYAVYHAWVEGRVLADPGRVVLVDQVQWVDGWPAVAGGPSGSSRPSP